MPQRSRGALWHAEPQPQAPDIGRMRLPWPGQGDVTIRWRGERRLLLTVPRTSRDAMIEAAQVTGESQRRRPLGGGAAGRDIGGSSGGYSGG